MPPPGRPRPDAATYARVDRVRSRRALDAARARPDPNPGRVAGASAEPHRVRQRDSRSARRSRSTARSLLPADEPDQQGFDNVASVLSVSPALLENYLSAAAHGQPARRRRSDAQPGRRHLQDSHGAGAGRSDRATTCRSDRRAARSIRYHFPARRRVHDQGAAAGGSCISTSSAWASRTSSTSASTACCVKRFTVGGEGKGMTAPGELRRQHAGRSGVGSVHAHRGRRPRSARAGEGGHARGRRLVRQAILGARRHPAAAADAASRRTTNELLPRQPGGGHRR